MVLRKLLLAVLCVLFAAAEAGAAGASEPLVINGQSFLTRLGPHLSLLRDPSGTLTVKDFQSVEFQDRLVPAGTGVPVAGFTRDVVWIQFELLSQSIRDETVIVELGMSRMGHFEWYVLDEDGNVLPLKTTRARFPTLELELPPGAHRTVLARTGSDTSIWLPLVAASPGAFATHAARRDFRDFAQFGFFLALALMGYGLWGGRRNNRLYLGVAVAMSGAILYFTLFNGLYAWLGGPWAQWMGRQGILVSVLLFSLMFTKFSQDFIGRNNLSHTINRLFWGCYGLIALMMALSLLLPFAVAVKLAQLTHLVAVVLAAGVSIRQAIVMRQQKGMGLFVSAWIVLLAGTLCFMLQLNGLLPLEPVSPYDALMIVFSSVFLLFLLAGVSSNQEAMRIETRVAELRQAETEARLAALRSQLHPHFLFNTLAAIQELAHEAPVRIPELTKRLSNFLRHRLGTDANSPEVPLSVELAAVQDYLAIEQIRFEERLTAVFNLEEAATKCVVQEQVLLPLVENAVKHGFAESDKVEIQLSARLRGEVLYLTVANNGAIRDGKPSTNSTGTGLENLRNRLRLRYGAGAAVTITSDGGKVVAAVELPVRSATSS